LSLVKDCKSSLLSDLTLKSLGKLSEEGDLWEKVTREAQLDKFRTVDVPDRENPGKIKEISLMFLDMLSIEGCLDKGAWERAA
jgi:hypothetical protein